MTADHISKDLQREGKKAAEAGQQDAPPAVKGQGMPEASEITAKIQRTRKNKNFEALLKQPPALSHQA